MNGFVNIAGCQVDCSVSCFEIDWKQLLYQSFAGDVSLGCDRQKSSDDDLAFEGLFASRLHVIS
jgi:hypothetical protein